MPGFHGTVIAWPAEGSGCLARGGHPAPLLMRADGAAGYPRIPAGPFIGVFADTAFTASTIRLEPGDTILLYTDGLTDARTGTARARSGDKALRAFAASIAPVTAAAAVTAIISLLDGFGNGLDDDTAVLALSVPSLPHEPR
jgi:phosphoserine phosphatase RsbU/P